MGKLVKLTLIGVFLYGFSYWRANSISAHEVMHFALQKDPVQTAVDLKSFKIQVGGQDYTIYPRFNYELHGMIVTQHDATGWQDLSHERWGDHINTADICVIWGENMSQKTYTKLEFWSGDWTCYFRTKDSVAYRQFRADQLSNNHIISATPEIQRQIHSLALGDQISLKGYLVDYQIGNSPARKSSVVRTDTGNGACEILYVTEVQRYFSPNKKWIFIEKISFYFVVLCLLGAIGRMVYFIYQK